MRDLQGVDGLLLKELKSCCAEEDNFLPRETGLKLMESTSPEVHSGVSAKCRDSRVEELWSLTSFFGYSTQTFVQAVNLLDRFLTNMKVQPKHVPCIGVCCLHIAAKMFEEESNVSPSHELIRISHSKFTVSDCSRMEKIILEKLCVEPKAVTALTFLHLYYSAVNSLFAGREEIPSIGRLEAQLKACLCRLVFSKAKIGDSELLHWKELVTKCMTDYCSSECNKPDNKKLVWILSRRTAQSLQSRHFIAPGLPTIPEMSWDESESEDSCEDMSCGEESPCGSLGSDGEGAFFPSTFLDCVA
ncbi:cyclin-G2 isoform X2 [Kryptolebias marmoratus]|uniref:cyclin-G2 isoform X2 n=1 Tax=Kryptolebias marmoratus TaxID=37003 RepID=UPI0007F8B440|nr:cyclin-G2 isoform X2 [Kryptolebias marmoratus]